MKYLVSKIRSQKTKLREKQAIKMSFAGLPLRENPLFGLFIAFMLWFLAMTVVAIDYIIRQQINSDIFLPLMGDGTFALIGLFATGLFLRIIKPDILKDNAGILMLSIISLITIVLTKALLYSTSTFNWIEGDISIFLIPFALSPLLATILCGSVSGVAVGVWTTLMAALMANRSFPVFIIGLIATVVTVYVSRDIRTRSKVIRAGFVIGLSEIVCVFGFTALNWENPSFKVILHQGCACLVSGVFSAIAVLLIMPLFEFIFRITSNITLFEFSDLGHPLLQRLAIEAPGTYHHSLVVANLAQAAADDIGANSLLTRVSAYFHDIGKLTKPDFFSENIQLQNNPHDDLLPSMSTLVIMSHVKEGLSLSMLYKLPKSVLNIISEHHGTSLMSYFHNKAKSQIEFELDQVKESFGQDGTKQTEGPCKVNETDFRYPGPKPSSRESAIICLADALEAASRTIQKKTPGHIEDLANDIIAIRFEDGQLDDCDLTFTELVKIKRSFIFTLTNIFHERVPYPENENRDKQ